MTVWIQKSGNNFNDDSNFAAWMGFLWRGQVIQFYSQPYKIHYKADDIVVGDLGSVNHILADLDIVPPNMYIPEGLESFCGRKIEKSTVGDVIFKCNSLNIKLFIKPITTKGFPAQVVEPHTTLITFPDQIITQPYTKYWLNEKCWVSETVNFVSEYRIFMKHAEALGCHIYLGDFRKQLDWSVIDQALEVLKSKQTPAGWCLDWGVTDDGRTLLIESNDGFSIGHYGFDCIEYSKLLERRWKELTNGKAI